MIDQMFEAMSRAYCEMLEWPYKSFLRLQHCIKQRNIDV